MHPCESPRRSSLPLRPRAPRQVLAECTPCDREDDDRSDARADNSGRSTEHRAEKHSADYGQISSNRQRKRHNPDIKRDVACDRERLVRGNELSQRVVMPRERLKREPPVPSQRNDNDRDNSDSDAAAPDAAAGIAGGLAQCMMKMDHSRCS